MANSENIFQKNNVSKKNLRSNPDQIKYLVDYMSTHNMFALGEYTGPLGRRTHNEEWVRLQGELRELGPDKTVEQWKNTWRDLKKKARIEGARHNQAINKTGNNPEHVPPVPSTSRKILSIIGTESAYGIAQSSETGLGEFPADVIVIEDSPIIPSNDIPPGPSISPPPQYSPPGFSMCPPPHISPPSLSTCISLLRPDPPTSLSPLPDSSNITSQIPTQTPNTRRRPPTSLKNDFLASDENTRSVLKEINNNLKYRNVLEEIKMRRNVTERLHKYRQQTSKHLGN